MGPTTSNGQRKSASSGDIRRTFDTLGKSAEIYTYVEGRRYGVSTIGFGHTVIIAGRSV